MEIMDDRELEKLLNTTEGQVPPAGLKERLFLKITASASNAVPALTPLERVIFEKPLRTACFVSLPAACVLWAILGNDLGKLLSGILG